MSFSGPRENSLSNPANAIVYGLWKDIVDLENKRSSFFQDLLVQGYIVDSLEVPKSGNNEDLESFVDVELKDIPRLKNSDYGRVVFKTKHVYTGNFKDWKFHGPGRYVWQDGTIYQGDFVDGLMHGQGTIQWIDGCTYEGSFVKGTRCGFGVYVLKDHFVYQGEWYDGLPHGQGRIWFNESDPESNYYDGEWADGFRNGLGTRQYSNGDRYHGTWENGERSGKGTMVWLSERQLYRGDWLDGLPHGHGVHIWFLDRSTRGSGAAFPTRHVYFGEWANGMRHGVGKMVYPCGSMYEGRWMENNRDGKGLYLNPAGDVIIGLFKTGNLIGGSDVPLHAPTYEFDYGGLVEWLLSKFQVERATEAVEEKQLTDLTLKYLSQLRQLYARAGRLHHYWADNGLYPYWKKGQFAGAAHMAGRTSKIHSADGVHHVTRMGLWLLLLDIPGVTEHASMAYFDKHFIDTPTISFQTRHNPFEPVYLWQFLQCLVITAIGLYIEIPEREARINELRQLELERETEKPVNLLLPPADPDRLSVDTENASVSERGGSIAGRTSDLTKVKKGRKPSKKESTAQGGSLKKSKKKTARIKASVVPEPKKGDGGSMESDVEIVIAKSAVKFQEMDEEDAASIARKKSMRPKKVYRKSKHSSLVNVKGEVIDPPNTPVVDPGVLLIEDKPPKEHNAGTNLPEVMSEEESEFTDDQNPVPFINFDLLSENGEEMEGEDQAWNPFWKPPKKRMPIMSIHEAFEKFLRERLIPCLNKSPGENLPQVPTPLPPFRDLWDSFEALHEDREWILAREFIQYVIPNKSLPTDEFAGEWDDVIPPEVMRPSKLEEEMLGESYEESPKEEGILKDVASEDFLGNVAHVEMLLKSDGEITENVLGLEESQSDIELNRQRTGSGAEFLTDPIPFQEEDLVPTPFLWQDKPKLVRVPKTDACANLEISDVTRVLRNMYPKLVTYGTSSSSSPELSGLNFKMIFVDWLLAVCECAKMSADRDLRPTVNPALRNWPDDEEEEDEEEYECSNDECYEEEADISAEE